MVTTLLWLSTPSWSEIEQSNHIPGYMHVIKVTAQQREAWVNTPHRRWALCMRMAVVQCLNNQKHLGQPAIFFFYYQTSLFSCWTHAHTQTICKIPDTHCISLVGHDRAEWPLTSRLHGKEFSSYSQQPHYSFSHMSNFWFTRKWQGWTRVTTSKQSLESLQILLIKFEISVHCWNWLLSTRNMWTLNLRQLFCCFMSQWYSDVDFRFLLWTVGRLTLAPGPRASS